MPASQEDPGLKAERTKDRQLRPDTRMLVSNRTRRAKKIVMCAQAIIRGTSHRHWALRSKPLIQKSDRKIINIANAALVMIDKVVPFGSLFTLFSTDQVPAMLVRK